MSVSPIEAIGPIQAMYSSVLIPLQSANGFKNVHITEQLDSDGRTMSTTEVVAITYDRFANLQTIPNPHEGTIDVSV